MQTGFWLGWLDSNLYFAKAKWEAVGREIKFSKNTYGFHAASHPNHPSKKHHPEDGAVLFVAKKRTNGA